MFTPPYSTASYLVQVPGLLLMFVALPGLVGNYSPIIAVASFASKIKLDQLFLVTLQVLGAECRTQSFMRRLNNEAAVRYQNLLCSPCQFTASDGTGTYTCDISSSSVAFCLQLLSRSYRIAEYGAIELWLFYSFVILSTVGLFLVPFVSENPFDGNAVFDVPSGNLIEAIVPLWAIIVLWGNTGLRLWSCGNSTRQLSVQLDALNVMAFTTTGVALKNAFGQFCGHAHPLFPSYGAGTASLSSFSGWAQHLSSLLQFAHATAALNTSCASLRVFSGSSFNVKVNTWDVEQLIAWLDVRDYMIASCKPQRRADQVIVTYLMVLLLAVSVFLVTHTVQGHYNIAPISSTRWFKVVLLIHVLVFVAVGRLLVFAFFVNMALLEQTRAFKSLHLEVLRQSGGAETHRSEHVLGAEASKIDFRYISILKVPITSSVLVP